ncbi:GTPase [Actinotalea sp. Marseille-Q4924]|uniref:GTPase n=1 Tax=Actinotalea sp. Marseille-Q4924 TaxID=2866571 RepID=UPI001CE3EABE|nr:GTPase [Actinotalea sp. Marseille-Q4924]
MTDLPPDAAGPRTRGLLHRVADLEEALVRGGGRLPEDAVGVARRSLAAVRERLALGVDHTVVALVGGTGSGKSSLFNALSGLRFADVGARRPTTSAVTACTWGGADPLLDWLGVAPDRRIERESALDGDTQAGLRGLVLLDLPDHDSVAEEHRAVVDRLLPMVDLLVWVVDPQKYADDALHTGYLRHLVGHEGSMLVVLNQVDTVPVGSQGALLNDIARLLREDGLADVPVHAASATTGDGVPVLRAAIARAVAGRGQAERRADAELADASRALAASVADGEPRNLPRDATVEELVRLVGADAGAEAVVAGAVPELVPADAERVAVVRRSWLDEVAGPLPLPWREAVDASVPSADGLREEADRAVTAVDLTPTDLSAAHRRRSVAVALAVVGGVLAVAAVIVGVVVADGTVVALVLGAAALVALLAAGAAAVGARGAADRDRRARAARLLAEVRTVLGGVVDEALVVPTRAVHADHRAVRRAATGHSAGHVAAASDDAPVRGAATAEPGRRAR